MEIGVTKIPLYGVFFFVGMLLAACVAVILGKKRKIEFFDFLCAVVYVMIGAAVGAKALFIVVSWKEIVRLKLSLLEIIRGGFVFYGGLIGGATGLFIYGRQFKLKLTDYTDVFATVLPLGHAFGRVGCLFGGCCYGVEYDGVLSVVYESSPNYFTPLGVGLFPTQLLEAVSLLCLFCVLLVLFLKDKARGYFAPIYLGAYAVLRFVLEYFRGDAERGGFLLCSTSQWIGVALLCVAIAWSIKIKRREKSKKNE